MTILFKNPIKLIWPLCVLTIGMGVLALIALQQPQAPSAESGIKKAKETALAKVMKDTKGNPIISTDEVRAHLLAQEEEYQILYQEAYDSFLISVNAAPFAQVREKAEKAFLKLIEAPESAACKLKVEVVSPHFANPEVAGQKFPLNFCTP